jgi:hypothetical protein
MTAVGMTSIGIICFTCDKLTINFEIFYYIRSMNQRIQEKIAQYKKAAKGHGNPSVANKRGAAHPDGLAKVIRSKKDADNFMAELNSVVKRANK